MEWFIWVSQWRFQGRGPEGPGPHLIFRPYWGPKGRRRFFWHCPRRPLISGSGWPPLPPPPPPHLRVWFRHCLFSWPRDRSVSRCMEDSCFCHFKCAYIKYTDEWWRSRKRWKPPAESTMNHPFIPGGSHEKRWGDGRRDIISKETNLGVVQTLLMFICWAWK